MAMVMENQQPLARMPLVPARPPLPPPPPQAYYKHRCKVCKKGFVCGRALGGHMRAHGVADDTLSADDDAIDDGGGASSSEAGSAPPAAAATAKRMYALRANPGRLKSCRVCENCGKEFTSWKSLLDHGRCHYDEEEGDLDGDIGDGAGNNDDEEGDELVLAGGWSKGKRTRRAKVMVVGNGTITTEEQVSAPSSEEEDLANFLVMLSSSSSSSAARPRVVVEVDDQERCVASKKEQRNHHQPLLPQPISMIAPASSVPQLKLLAPPQVLPHHVSTTVPRGMFECKACKKVFTSHQALGGHRASHKKVKGCFAAKLESNNRNDPPQQPPVVVASASEKVIVDAIPAIIRIEQNITGVDGNAEGNTANNYGAAVAVMATAAPEMAAANEVAAAPSAAKKKGKVHECSICHRVFMSGQALGGHKRCHWLTAAGAGAGDLAVANLHPYVTQDHVMHAMCQQLTLGRPAMFDAASDPFLDLNVPTATANPSPAAAAARQAAAELNDGVLSLTAPAASLYMQSWAAGHSKSINMNNTATSGHYYDAAAEAAATEDEADSTSAKRAKISDLKDMNMGGETSPWLQVGIGLPSEIDEEKQATQA